MSEPGAADDAATDALPRVAASEAELIGLARALIMGHGGEVAQRVFRARALPPAISTACARLLGDALSKLWPALWRRGGAAPGVSVDANGAVRRGRAWERDAVAPLMFSAATLQLLRWLIASPLVELSRSDAPWTGAPLTVGDQVMIYLALEATEGTPAQARLARHVSVRGAPLAWLGFCDVLARTGALPPVLRFDGLCRGGGARVVEALTPRIAARWRATELAKRGAGDPEALIALGAAQDAVLGDFLAACDASDRMLAAFVIDAAAPLLARELDPAPQQLATTSTLASRSAARLAAGALLRAVGRWAAWDEAHRGVRFLDDEYAATQRLLARFEAIGAIGAARAATWLAALAALAPTTSPASAATVEAP